VWYAVCGVWFAVCGVRHVVCGVRCVVWCAVCGVLWSSFGLVTVDKRLNLIVCSFDLRSFQVSACHIPKCTYTETVFSGVGHCNGTSSAAHQARRLKFQDTSRTLASDERAAETKRKTCEIKIVLSSAYGAVCGSHVMPFCHLAAWRRLTLGPASTCDGAGDTIGEAGIHVTLPIS
jgi:hypothetical protein